MFVVFLIVVMCTSSLIAAPAPVPSRIIIRGSGGNVESLAFSPDGKYFATGHGSCDEPGAIRVWDTSTGSLKIQLKGHSKGVCCIKFSRDGELLVSAGYEGKVVFWSCVTGKDIRSVDLGESNWITRICFSPDSSRLALGSVKTGISLYDLKTGRLSCRLSAPDAVTNTMVFSEDGKLLATGNIDSTIKVWSVVERKLIWSVKQKGNVKSLVFSADGSFLISGTGGDYESFEKIEFYSVMENDLYNTYSHCGDVAIWDTKTGGMRTKYHISKGHVNSLALSPEDKYLAIGIGSASVIDPSLGKIRLLELQTGRFFTLSCLRDCSVYCVYFSAKRGKIAVLGTGDKVYLVNLIRTLRPSKDSEGIDLLHVKGEQEKRSGSEKMGNRRDSEPLIEPASPE